MRIEWIPYGLPKGMPGTPPDRGTVNDIGFVFEGFLPVSLLVSIVLGVAGYSNQDGTIWEDF